MNRCEDGMFVQYAGVRTLQMNGQFEGHCIEITKLDKQIKNIDSRIVQIEKELNDRAVDNCDAGALALQKEINELYDDLDKKYKSKSALQGMLIQVDDCSVKPVTGKTSGVTGGAVVEIKRDGKCKQYMLKNIFDTGKKYKNIFGREKRHSGKHFYNPNAKSTTSAFVTRQTLKEVNNSVLQEFIALRLANVVSPGIAPDAILGKISGDDNGSSGKTRYCLLTEMAGKSTGATFETLNEVKQSTGHDNYGVSKTQWKSAFAIGIGLLNDRDFAKKGNIGRLKQQGGGQNTLSLFDLGHPTPDEYRLDHKTLLPKSKSVVLDVILKIVNVFVKVSNMPGVHVHDKDIEGQLSVEDRRAAIDQLLKKQDSILGELDNIKKSVESVEDKKVVEDMERRIKARFEQLGKIIDEHDKWLDDQSRKAAPKVKAKTEELPD